MVGKASEEAGGVMATYTPGDNVGEDQDWGDQDEQGCLGDQNDKKEFRRKSCCRMG